MINSHTHFNFFYETLLIIYALRELCVRYNLPKLLWTEEYVSIANAMTVVCACFLQTDAFFFIHDNKLVLSRSSVQMYIELEQCDNMLCNAMSECKLKK